MADELSNRFPLLKYLDGLVDDLRDLVPRALQQFDEVSIHKARVSTRRLKAAIELLQPILSDKHREPFAEAGRKLRRKLGPLRDLDVMIDHLQRLSRQKRHATACTWLIEQMNNDRDTAREDAQKKSPASAVLARLGAWWGVHHEIEECEEAAPHLLANAVHLRLDHFAEQADWLTGLRQPPPDHANALDPHELRIAGKALRYTLEFAVESGIALPKMLLRKFKLMQELLGSWHDYVVLTDKAMSIAHERELVLHDAEKASGVLDLSRMTLARSTRELQAFYKVWKADGESVASTIRQSFSLSSDVHVDCA